MAGPLSGIKILDFTWALAGPYGTMIMADLGADVWKIETVFQNEQRRGGGPYVHGVSTYFFSANRGKKSVMLDLKSPEVKEAIYKIVPQVDIVNENFQPGTMTKLGFDYETLSKLNPRLIYASTSGFGQTGPYSARGAVDIIAQGMSGLMSTTGHVGGPPARPGYSIGDMGGGIWTTVGVLAALQERNVSGKGQHVDVAMLDAQITFLENAVVRYTSTGDVPGPVGYRHPIGTPHQAVPASDGWVVVAGVKDHTWPLFCARIGLDELGFDPRFEKAADRTKNYEELEPYLFEAFGKRTVDEWLEELAEVCWVGPLNTIDKMVVDPQVQAREMIRELPTWTGETLKVANTPMKLSRTPAGAEHGAAKPGEHTVDFLKMAGLEEAEVQALIDQGVAAMGPEDPESVETLSDEQIAQRVAAGVRRSLPATKS
ncbi:MAG: CoA transferase [Dehalococcoidia bacterium]|nr:CoA transferase [Dehalococcoidia bacterium]